MNSINWKDQKQEEQMSNTQDDFDRMLHLSEVGRSQHKERRDVIFRTFISYMTLLVVSFAVIIRYWDYDMVESVFATGLVIFAMKVFFTVLCISYCNWLKTVYKASIYDVRRRDFYLKKAEVICYHLSKDWAERFNPGETVLLNLAGKSYEIKEKALFEKSKPDIQDFIPKALKLKEPCEPDVRADPHYNFHARAPIGLTILIVLSLIAKFVLILRQFSVN